MTLSSKAKRNSLIAAALVILFCVFNFSGCMGKLLNGGSQVEAFIPSESFAIINITGTIQGGSSSPFETLSYDHNSIMSYIDFLIEDDSNYGILLKVNSGGGTVYHSDEMYLKLMEYKEATGRPIHAYFEQTAASGAYYISCAADYISANRNCWTGSIGVILSYVNMKGLYDKLGMEEVIISSGSNKGMGSAGGTLTEEQRAIYQSLVDESYDTFVEIVAQGRNMDIDAVKVLADGRVYTATQAKQAGLVDEVELWQAAYDKMCQVTGVEGYEKSFYQPISWANYLFGKMEDMLPKSEIQAATDLVDNGLQGTLLYYYQ